MAVQTDFIPQPPGKPFVGNLLDLGARTPLQDLMVLAREYGPIFQLDMLGRPLVVISNHELVNEVSDESRFDKKIWSPLKEVRAFAGDGLFTAYTSEPNWSKAHHILLPNFSQRAMLGYHPMMLDIAEQMMLKWERLNSDDEIDVVHDMTALTLDTIGLCGFDYRFNSFYRESFHPFIDAMSASLLESQERQRRLPIENKIRKDRQRHFQTDIDFMNTLVDRIIKERRESGEDYTTKQDLLSYMLAGVDKKTGERLDDLNIRYQIITFLIAGHETTSGLLSFTLYYLLNNPDVLSRAYAEVDRVLGSDPSAKISYAQVNQLTYISQILKESLRLWPTAPMIALYPYEDTQIGGKYKIRKNQQISLLIPSLHRDRTIWGDRAEVFDPDNFTREAERGRPPNAYKPFGNGQRACIGRQFALQEAMLLIGMILQRFRLVDHTRYKLKFQETLTIKPAGFKIKIKPRTDRDRAAIAGRVAEPVSISAAPRPTEQPPTSEASRPKHGTKLLVLYGSNLGTAEEIARQIGQAGEANGFQTTVAPLDTFARQLPTEGAVTIVTASYNGTPPDNAVEFCDWLRGHELQPDALAGVNYTVFGCGNQDWASTFQAIPRLIDDRLARYGAHRLYERGEGDASDDFDSQFQGWYDALWPTFAREFKLDLTQTEVTANLYEVEIVQSNRISPFVASLGAKPMTVTVNRELHTKDGPSPSDRSARHIELKLPEGVTYRAGDHLGVIAHNSEALVKRVATRFGFDSDTTYVRLRLNGNRKSFLPTEGTISVYKLLADYVELQDVATRKQIRTLAELSECPPEKVRLLALSGDDEASRSAYKEEVLNRRKSLIDLLEENPACVLPFAVYLEMLPALRPRYYSISSSPRHDSAHCSLTVAVVEGPARSGGGTFRGVCSNYLRQANAGVALQAFVRDTGSNFRLPDDPTTPLIMVGPGTGLAPFRGFLQERAAQQAEGQTVGPSLLFFGSRGPEQDYLYQAELEAFAEAGVTTLHTAFSRVVGWPKVYVQHVMLEQRAAIWELLEAGAVVYVCGDATRMAPDVRRALALIYQKQTGADEATASAWLDGLAAANRYLVDVWAAS